MGVAAGGCQADVADRRLHQMRRRTAVEGVADMGVAQPVGGDRRGEAGPLGGPLAMMVILRLVAVGSPKPLPGDNLTRCPAGVLGWCEP
jgi:hypothetical protein